MNSEIKSEFKSGRDTTVFFFRLGHDCGCIKQIKKNLGLAKEFYRSPTNRAYWLGRLRGVADIRSGRIGMDRGRA